jgi:hypothetical protein
MTKISSIGTTETALSNVLYLEGERGDGTSVKIPPSISSAMSLISESSPTGTGAVSFTSIPSAFRDLTVVVRGRGAATATSVTVTMTFNGDTGSNYDYERASGSNNSTSSAAGTVGATSIDLGGIAAASATANVADCIRAEIFDYRGTTFQKAALIHQGTKTGTANTNLTCTIKAAWWRNIAAINRVDVTLSSGNFVTGSVVSLYGRY